MGSTTVSHLPRCPRGKVLDDDAVIGLPAGRVAAPDGTAAARRGAAEAASRGLASASSLAGQLHADPVEKRGPHKIHSVCFIRATVKLDTSWPQKFPEKRLVLAP